MTLVRRQIAERIAEVGRREFGEERFGQMLRSVGRTAATLRVKEVFGKLGQEIGYEVASGYPGADVPKERLYDMVWFTSTEGLLRRQVMVLETEATPGAGLSQVANVDKDFKKLVQARADVHVWFASIHNSELATLHIENCRKQASAFESAMQGDIYVFIVFVWATNQTTIEIFETS